VRYLLDTKIASDLVRRPQGLIAQHIREVDEAPARTTELRYGASKKGSQRPTAELEAVLDAHPAGATAPSGAASAGASASAAF
jgi:tRNA(fMet)-specific endonuclease VapC